ncbi:MAG: hypothetical protein AUJ57_09185 [Zetaproteobacteria bacterium CG1_02_53_45]|nr:MAG: hypothetical protein AUJ57_09185 [Zetaproteobacteria bacterium CG1_02_53_45]
MASRVWPATLHRVNIVRRLPLLTELSLLALLIWLLAGWLLPSDKSGSAGSQPSDLSISPSTTLPALGELIAVPLFGETPPPQSMPQSKPVQQSQPAIKPLQIILIGTVMAGEHSAAVVSIDSKPAQQTVFVGKQIQPGVTLFHVDSDAIVVEQSGRRQLVSLQREVLQGMTISEDRPAATGNDAGKVPAARLSDKSASSLQSDKKTPLTRPAVAGIASLLTQAIFTPHVSDGKQDGLQISHIVLGSPFHKSGLFNGDVIRSANGQAFDHAKDAMELLRIMQASGPIDFEIMRAGNVQDIHFNQPDE